jgi:hypothetical protein
MWSALISLFVNGEIRVGSQERDPTVDIQALKLEALLMREPKYQCRPEKSLASK